ncbi:hypothetical protein ACFZB4_43110 [Streptomyces pseudovenezuelae]|uniref:hypothetical protein n=1 Tax=Streptomyces pseudovenezuelae TaxID=67350 RepID=UPI0036F181C1
MRSSDRVTVPCTTDAADDINDTAEPPGTAGQDADAAVPTDPYADARAFEDLVMEKAYEIRQETRARTHAKIAKVPRALVWSAGALVGTTATVITLHTWGMTSALTMQLGAVMAAAYTVMNDIRISIAEKNPTWRLRHRLISFIVRRHPLDRD